MLSIATLPWENEMVWQTTTACPQVLRQVSTSSIPGSLLLVLWSLERGFLLLVTKGHYTAKQCFSFWNNLLFRLDSIDFQPKLHLVLVYCSCSNLPRSVRKLNGSDKSCCFNFRVQNSSIHQWGQILNWTLCLMFWNLQTRWIN